MFSRRFTKMIAIGFAVVAIAGGTYGIVSASAGTGSAATTTTTTPATTPAPRGGGGGAGSNARSGPAAGGSSGTVTSVSTPSFTLTTAAGQKVTVNETSSTKYLNKRTSISARAVKEGANLLVLGTTSGTTITADQVIVLPAGSEGAAASAAAGVVPFQPGAPSTSKQVGQIPSNYTEGSGTIVSGTPATRATKVALAAYPGGVVDRVVKLSNGEYEVHYIGVNWPHHIFVDQNFKVVGAD
jgi:hypothetical protein